MAKKRAAAEESAPVAPDDPVAVEPAEIAALSYHPLFVVGLDRYGCLALLAVLGVEGGVTLATTRCGPEVSLYTDWTELPASVKTQLYGCILQAGASADFVAGSLPSVVAADPSSHLLSEDSTPLVPACYLLSVDTTVPGSSSLTVTLDARARVRPGDVIQLLPNENYVVTAATIEPDGKWYCKISPAVHGGLSQGTHGLLVQSPD
jgi:hypothetical protein